MLHIETVEPRTLSVLKRLMEVKELSNFSLVGGTALSLKYGHRISIDLDLFYHKKFDQEIIIKSLIKKFGKGYSTESRNTKWGIFCYIEGVKVDIVYHPHPLIGAIEMVDGIRMYSDEDIIAMKLNAILGRGKKKDFWDLHELLQHYPLQKMSELHEAKFPQQNLLITIPQAITYFTDADESETPISLKKQTWEKVKKEIQKKVSEYLT
jgi:predicted nucleotidyltransferase component of viral defense system